MSDKPSATPQRWDPYSTERGQAIDECIRALRDIRMKIQGDSERVHVYTMAVVHCIEALKRLLRSKASLQSETAHTTNAAPQAPCAPRPITPGPSNGIAPTAALVAGPAEKDSGVQPAAAAPFVQSAGGVKAPPMLPDERIMAWVRILKVADEGRAYPERITPLDVEACVRGAVKEQYRLVTEDESYAPSSEGEKSSGVCDYCRGNLPRGGCPYCGQGQPTSFPTPDRDLLDMADSIDMIAAQYKIDGWDRGLMQRAAAQIRKDAEPSAAPAAGVAPKEGHCLLQVPQQTPENPSPCAMAGYCLSSVHGEVVRYCAGCGSVGEVVDEFRDCCPDGKSMSVYIPYKVARQCSATFKAAIGATLSPRSATPVKKDWGRAKVGVDGNCGYALLGENLQEGEAEFVEIDRNDHTLSANRQERKAWGEALRKLEERLGSGPLRYEVLS